LATQGRFNFDAPLRQRLSRDRSGLRRQPTNAPRRRSSHETRSAAATPSVAWWRSPEPCAVRPSTRQGNARQIQLRCPSAATPFARQVGAAPPTYECTASKEQHETRSAAAAPSVAWWRSPEPCAVRPSTRLGKSGQGRATHGRFNFDAPLRQHLSRDRSGLRRQPTNAPRRRSSTKHAAQRQLHL